MERMGKISKELNEIRVSKGDAVFMESLVELINELNFDNLNVSNKPAINMILSKFNGILYNLQKK